MTLVDVLQDAWAQGGLAVPPLFAIALLLGWGLGERAWNLRRGTRLSVSALWTHGDSNKGVIGAASATLKRLPASLRNAEHIEVTLVPFFNQVDQGRALVKALVVAAPLLGLLGTVTGMIETFDSMAEMALFRQSGGVAGGVAQALLSTQVGLCVAIPGLLAGRLLDRLATQRRDDLDRLALVAMTEAEASQENA